MHNDMIVLAGLFEKDENDHLFKAYVCVDKNGLVAKHRKLHPFINPHLKAGEGYCVFEISGWKCGILIWYDNNISEIVRATKLLGADIIFMPLVTMCTRVLWIRSYGKTGRMIRPRCDWNSKG